MSRKKRDADGVLAVTISRLLESDEDTIADELIYYCASDNSFDKGVLKNLQDIYNRQKQMQRMPKTDLLILLNQFASFYNLLKTSNLKNGFSLHQMYYIPKLDDSDKQDLKTIGLPIKVIKLLDSIPKQKKFPSYELHGFVKYIDRKMTDNKVTLLSDKLMSTLLDYISNKIASLEYHKDSEKDDQLKEITVKSHFLETCIEYLDKGDWRRNWLSKAPNKNSFVHGDGSKNAGITVINPRHKDDMKLSINAAKEYWEKRRDQRFNSIRWTHIKRNRDEKNWYIYVPPYVHRHVHPKWDPEYDKMVTMKKIGPMKVATFPNENEGTPANIANYLGWLILNSQLAF